MRPSVIAKVMAFSSKLMKSLLLKSISTLTSSPVLLVAYPNRIVIGYPAVIVNVFSGSGIKESSGTEEISTDGTS